MTHNNQNPFLVMHKVTDNAERARIDKELSDGERELEELESEKKPDAYLSMAEMKLKLGHAECALRDCVNAIKIRPTQRAYIIAVQSAIEADRPTKAAALAAKGARINGEGEHMKNVLIFWRAKANCRLGLVEKALADCHQLSLKIKKMPDCLWILNLMKECAQTLSSPQKLIDKFGTRVAKKAIITSWQIGLHYLSMNLMTGLFNIAPKDQYTKKAWAYLNKEQNERGLFPAAPWLKEKSLDENLIDRICDAVGDYLYHAVRDGQENSFRRGEIQFTSADRIRESKNIGADEQDSAACMNIGQSIEGDEKIPAFMLIQDEAFMLCLSSKKGIREELWRNFGTKRNLVKVNTRKLLTAILQKLPEGLPRVDNASIRYFDESATDKQDGIENGIGICYQLGIARMQYKNRHSIIPSHICKRKKFKPEYETRIILTMHDKRGYSLTTESWGLKCTIDNPEECFEDVE